MIPYLAVMNKHKTKRSAKYLEALERTVYLKQTFDDTSLQQRIPAYLIPVPCETSWARARAYPPAKVNDFYKHLSKKVPKYVVRNDDLPEPQIRQKRGREMFELPPADAHLIQGRMMPYQLPLETPANVAAVHRKLYDQLDNDDLVTPTAPIEEVDESLPHRFGRDLNLPIADNFGTPVWAKFYPPQEVTVNSLVDCIGILSEAPLYSVRGADMVDDSKFAEIPAPTAPRFHAILVKRLDEANPLFDITDEEYEARKQDIFSRLPHLRSSLLEWMTCILGGDAISAEYLLCNFIARPFHRESEHSTIGHMPINFLRCEITNDANSSNPQENGDHIWMRSFRGRLELILETLLPKRHTITLSPSYLDTHILSPYESQEFERLESGELQIPLGTHLTLDETEWNPSEATEKATSQLEVLSTFIHQQSVHYQFTNYSLPFHVDCPTVVLSSGKSVFEIVCAVPIHTDLSTLPPPPVDDQQLEDWRFLLGILRLADWPEQSPEVLQAIEEDFVAIRKMPGNEYLTPELFAHWNILARASSVSHGESVLSETRWNEMKSLESDRLRRL